jgi:hypothetical protein
MIQSKLLCGFCFDFLRALCALADHVITLARQSRSELRMNIAFLRSW